MSVTKAAGYLPQMKPGSKSTVPHAVGCILVGFCVSGNLPELVFQDRLSRRQDLCNQIVPLGV